MAMFNERGPARAASLRGAGGTRAWFVEAHLVEHDEDSTDHLSIDPLDDRESRGRRAVRH